MKTNIKQVLLSFLNSHFYPSHLLGWCTLIGSFFVQFIAGFNLIMFYDSLFTVDAFSLGWCVTTLFFLSNTIILMILLLTHTTKRIFFSALVFFIMPLLLYYNVPHEGGLSTRSRHVASLGMWRNNHDKSYRGFHSALFHSNGTQKSDVEIICIVPAMSEWFPAHRQAMGDDVRRALAGASLYLFPGFVARPHFLI